MVRLVALILSLVCFAAPACAADLAGTWAGSWSKEGDVLPVIVTFEHDGAGYRGHFESDALQVADIPFSAVTVTGDAVHFTLTGDDSTIEFTGEIKAASFNGTFRDGAVSGGFALIRTQGAPAAIASRDVMFSNGDVHLSGTMLLPEGSGTHPAIVFLHGSGPEGRFANRWLAQKFVRAGVVALIYDKRGVGGSTGDWKTAGFDELAADGAAAASFLRTQAEVNGDYVGVYGHSQGGTLSPLVAIRDGKLAFLIATSAGGIAPAEVEIYSVENSIGIGSLSPAERADADTYVRALIAVAYGGKPRESLDPFIARFKDRSWFFAPPPPESSYWTISRKIAPFDPVKAWAQVHVPVLLLYGRRDERIPVEPSMDAISRALRYGVKPNYEAFAFPGLDHNFVFVEPAQKGGWPKHYTGYAEIMTHWARAVIPFAFDP